MASELQIAQEPAPTMAARNDVLMGVAPERLDQAIALANVMAKSDLVPKEFRGQPANIVIALQLSAEIGLTPMQGLNNIAVINGRPTVWGDAMLALVLRSPVCEYVHEPEIGDDLVAVCEAKRKGSPAVVRRFTQDDAQRANLWGKQGPWTQYPRRMLQMRARAFALRDAFADVLRGIGAREEVEDYELVDTATGEIATPRPTIVQMPQRKSAPTPAPAATETGGDQAPEASPEPAAPAATVSAPVPELPAETTQAAAPATNGNGKALPKPLDYHGQAVKVLRVWRPNPGKAGHLVETNLGVALAYSTSVVQALESAAKSNAAVTFAGVPSNWAPAPYKISGVKLDLSATAKGAVASMPAVGAIFDAPQSKEDC